MYIQTIVEDFPRIRERQPPSISGTFVRLIVLDYKRAKQSHHEREIIETALVKTSCVFEGWENLTSKS